MVLCTLTFSSIYWGLQWAPSNLIMRKHIHALEVLTFQRRWKCRVICKTLKIFFWNLLLNQCQLFWGRAPGPSKVVSHADIQLMQFPLRGKKWEANFFLPPEPSPKQYMIAVHKMVPLHCMKKCENS